MKNQKISMDIKTEQTTKEIIKECVECLKENNIAVLDLGSDIAVINSSECQGFLVSDKNRPDDIIKSLDEISNITNNLKEKEKKQNRSIKNNKVNENEIEETLKPKVTDTMLEGLQPSSSEDKMKFESDEEVDKYLNKYNDSDALSKLKGKIL
ncbi:MAG: hypothetical protein ACOC3V_03505 [bacterium]